MDFCRLKLSKKMQMILKSIIVLLCLTVSLVGAVQVEQIDASEWPYGALSLTKRQITTTYAIAGMYQAGDRRPQSFSMKAMFRQKVNAGTPQFPQQFVYFRRAKPNQNYVLAIVEDADYDIGRCKRSASAREELSNTVQTDANGTYKDQIPLNSVELLLDYATADDSLNTILDYVLELTQEGGDDTTLKSCGTIRKTFNNSGKRYFNKYFKDLDD